MSIIQWFPGHMAKTIKDLKQQFKGIDIIIELLDARIPLSSRNPVITDLISERHHHIICLTKVDLADPGQTKKWVNYLKIQNKNVIKINVLKQHGVKQLIETCKQVTEKKRRSRRFYISKVMICGIPNVGKSALINKFAKKRAAAVQNKPGITKQTRGVMIDKFIELIDTPGILWPKIKDEQTGLKLALTKAIKQTISDDNILVEWFLEFCIKNYPERLKKRYKLTQEHLVDEDIISHIGHSMNWIKQNGELNDTKIYRSVIEDFQTGKLGIMSLDTLD
jgi:ribosome biogenesis GTPase A